MTDSRKAARIAKEATVRSREHLTDNLVRLRLNSPDLIGADLPYTDHYIKLLFSPHGADYSWPWDNEAIREQLPRDQHPVTRTYTLRSADTSTGDIVVDFVVHGDEGLAAPWARTAEPGDTIGFLGPGGAWGPSPDYDHLVAAGDESAAPAIAAALEALGPQQTATAYIEVRDNASTFDMPTAQDRVEIVWVPRDGQTHGTALSQAVRDGGYPAEAGKGRTQWFIHGVAEMIKELRRFLFVDGQIAREDVSISGYWRLGMTEDQWQSSKREFQASMEQDEQAQNTPTA